MEAAGALALAQFGRGSAIGEPADETMAEDFAILGVEFEPVDDDEGEGGFAIWKPSWASWLAFMACQTQWVPQGGLGGLLLMGLNYANVDVLLRRRDADPAVFDDILVMERAFLEALAESPPS